MLKSALFKLLAGQKILICRFVLIRQFKTFLQFEKGRFFLDFKYVCRYVLGA